MLQFNVNLKNYNSFGIACNAHEVFVFNDLKQLDQLTDLINQHPHSLIIGGGSNMILPNEFAGLVVLNQLQGLEVVEENSHSATLLVSSGMVWDKLVAFTVEKNWFGLENLSLIPGTVGAAPVQNIGAYGVEVKDTIVYVEYYDFDQKKLKIINNLDCEFSYRDSIFKKFDFKYLITKVCFKLVKNGSLNLNYADVNKYLLANNISTPSLQQLRDAIISIRSNKLPDPRQIGNVGSFFHNPIVSIEQANQLKIKYPDLVMYDVGGNMRKLAAGWLIENAGLKGYIQGQAGVFARQALILINLGSATATDVINLAKFIIDTVYLKYQVKLNIEPLIVESK